MSMLTIVFMVSMLTTVTMMSVFLTKAAVLTIEDTAGVAQPSLAAPGLVNTLVLVWLALRLLTGEAGGSVGGGVGVGGVEVRAGEGDKVPVRDVNAALLVAPGVSVGGVLADEDDVAVLTRHPLTSRAPGLLAAADREDDDENDTEDEEEAADDDPGHHVLLFCQVGLKWAGPDCDGECGGGVVRVEHSVGGQVNLPGHTDQPQTGV